MFRKVKNGRLNPGKCTSQMIMNLIVETVNGGCVFQIAMLNKLNNMINVMKSINKLNFLKCFELFAVTQSSI